MKTAEKRKYRSRDFGVGIATSVPPTAFYEIEALARTLGISKSGVARLLVLRGLAEYHRDGKLTAPVIMPLGEASTCSSDVQGSN